jgi:hypothetical protein
MKKLSLILLVILVTFLFMTCKKNESNPTQTQTTGTVQGQITNTTGDTVIAGALVTTSPATSSVSSNTQGNYTIANVSPGQYTVTAAKGGYTPGSVAISVSAGQTTTANIHLSYVAGTSLPTNGLVAYFPFNGNANDESGHGNNLTVNNAILTTDRFGNANKAYSFNGINAYLSLSSFNGINPGNSVHTISGWIYISQLPPSSGRAWPLLFGNAGTNTSELWILGNEGTYAIGFYDIITFSTTATVGVWTHVCVTYDGSAIKGYINGQLVQTISASNWNLSGIPLTFAKAVSTYPAEKFFQGSMDDFRFYNRVLSDAEIQVLYHEGGW